jgi:hypothetical protein
MPSIQTPGQVDVTPTRRSVVLLLVAMILTLAACAGGDRGGQATPGESIDVLEGTWNLSERACNDNPFTLQVGSARETITLTFAEPDAQGQPATSVYRLTRSGRGFVGGQIDGEGRVTDRGDPVAWDFVILNADTFCWRRADWSRTSCTQSVRRCPAGT